MLTRCYTNHDCVSNVIMTIYIYVVQMTDKCILIYKVHWYTYVLKVGTFEKTDASDGLKKTCLLYNHNSIFRFREYFMKIIQETRTQCALNSISTIWLNKFVRRWTFIDYLLVTYKLYHSNLLWPEYISSWAEFELPIVIADRGKCTCILRSRPISYVW